MAGRKAETMTTETEDNTELLAREECSRLARQLRLMENDKKAYLEESNAAISQQKKTIKTLEEENNKIEAELESQKTRRNESLEGSNFYKIANLLDHFVSLENEVKSQSKISTAVNKQLSLAAFRLAQLKAKMESNNLTAGKRNNISNKEMDCKEFAVKKKLQTVTSQFDSIVADNTELRNIIDDILNENVRVMKRCQELEYISNNNKTEIDDFVDQATTAYDQREESVAKANALFERNEKEKKQYILEISELNRLIRHEEKLLDFMSTKNQDRAFLETDDERLSRLECAKEQTMEDALESYRENLSKLITTESPTLQSLVEEYAQLWSDNINRFHYINELNNEIESLQADVECLREEIKHCAVETVERNQEKTADINKKQDELNQMKDEFGSIQAVVNEYKSFTDDIVKLIERIFYITDFEDAKPVLELIGNQQEVSSQNSILYLNILESRISEIMTSFKLGGSGRATPSKSPRPHTNKSVSEISVSVTGAGINRPRILISGRGRTISIDNPENSEEDTVISLVEEEPSPLEYFTMRGKLLDSMTVKCASDTESILNDNPSPTDLI